jgi:hypothetical protein
MLRHADSYKLTDVSEVFIASIIRAISRVMEAISTSEMSVSFYETTRRNIPEYFGVCVV